MSEPLKIKHPDGVTLYDPSEPETLRQLVLDRAKGSFEKRFPFENEKVRIDASDFKFDDKNYTIKDVHDALMEGGRLTVPLRASVKLTDKKTGEILDQKENHIVANIPWVTHRGTVVWGGNEYSPQNQLRLKSGVFARRKANGELESHINVKPGTGQGFRISMEPDTGIYRANIGQATIKLYPVLKALGVDDDKLREHWGEDVLKANQDAFDKKAVGKFYSQMMGSKTDPTADEKAQALAIADKFNKTEVDDEVSFRTLGHPHKNIDTDLILKSSAKLLRINKNEDEEDDRDSMMNKSFHTWDDFLSDRISKDAGGLGRNLAYKATYDRSLKQFRPGYFTKHAEGLIIGNQLTQLTPAINPVEIYDQRKRVIQLGEGGISSMDSVSDRARSVNPTQLGVIDPIRTSESGAVGIDQRLAAGARKGSDNRLYFPVRNRKSGEYEYKSWNDLHGKTLAFPNAKSLTEFGYVPPMEKLIAGDISPANMLTL
jgi:DNA-directed RNA polymerase beta subunit